jgi:hypothetical protein
VWRAQRFSAWMTSALHRLPGADDFQDQLQLAELEYVIHSETGATSLAENYVGFPHPTGAMDVPWSMLAENRHLRRQRIPF